MAGKTNVGIHSGMSDILYPSYFKLHVRWLSSLTPVTYLSKLLGIRCVAALLGLWPRPFGASASAVQGTSALSCNSNYLGYSGVTTLALFQRLTQCTGWRMGGTAEVAYVINSPALTLADHQHFILPALRTLLQGDAQRNVAGIGIRDG